MTGTSITRSHLAFLKKEIISELHSRLGQLKACGLPSNDTGVTSQMVLTWYPAMNGAPGQPPMMITYFWFGPLKVSGAWYDLIVYRLENGVVAFALRGPNSNAPTDPTLCITISLHRLLEILTEENDPTEGLRLIKEVSDLLRAAVLSNEPRPSR